MRICVLVAVENVFSGSNSEDAEAALVSVMQGRPDLGVVEHSVAFLVEKGHVDADGVAGAAARVTQNLLRLHESLRREKSSRQKVARYCENQYILQLITS